MPCMFCFLSRSLFHSDGALFVIWFSGYRIERALRHPIGIRLNEMERHEDLTRRNDFSHAQFDGTHTPSGRDNIDAIMRIQTQLCRILRIHLQPRARGETVEYRNRACLGPRVPMLHSAASVEHEWKLLRGLLWERLPIDT